MRVPAEVRDVARASRLFFFALHGLGFSILILLDSEIQQELVRGNVKGLAGMLMLVVLASYFYLICGENPGSHYPGHLDKDISVEMRTNSPASRREFD